MLGSSPCSTDTDGDSIEDNFDPCPLAPSIAMEVLEVIAQDLAGMVEAMPLSQFSGPNDNIRTARRNSLANRLRDAATAIAAGKPQVAIGSLSSVSNQVDGITAPPDWMVDSADRMNIEDGVRLLMLVLGC